MTKKSYGRGAGETPDCAQNLDKDAGLCYQPCKSRFDGAGPVCWRNDSANTAYGIQCNPFAFGTIEADCEDLNRILVKAKVTNGECIGSLAAAIVLGQAVGPRSCRKILIDVMPQLVYTKMC